MANTEHDTSNDTVELTYPAAEPDDAIRRKIRKAALVGVVLGTLSLLGILILIAIQWTMSRPPDFQHIIVVNLKDNLVEAAIVRQQNTIGSRSDEAEYPTESILVATSARRGENITHLAIQCIAELMPSLPLHEPRTKSAQVLFVVSGKDVLRRWSGCNISEDLEKTKLLAIDIVANFSDCLELAKDPVRAISGEHWALTSFTGTNRQHPENASVGVIGVDSTAAFVAFDDSAPSNNSVSAFSKAFYCIGLDEMRRTYLAYLLRDNPSVRSAKDPCAPKQIIYSETWNSIWRTSCSEEVRESQKQPRTCPEDERHYQTTVNIDFTGTGNPRECQRKLEAVFQSTQGSNNVFSGQKIPRRLLGEYLFADSTGSIVRALEFSFKDREGPGSRDESVLAGRDLYLNDIVTAVKDFCSKSLNPREMRVYFQLNATLAETRGLGKNSDIALRRTCFDAFFGVELLGALGMSRVEAEDLPRNHIVIARPPGAEVEPSRLEEIRQDHEAGQYSFEHTLAHEGVHHSGHESLEWTMGYLTSPEGSVEADLTQVRPMSSLTFCVFVILLAVGLLIGAIVATAFLAQLSKLGPSSDQGQTLQLRT